MRSERGGGRGGFQERGGGGFRGSQQSHNSRGDMDGRNDHNPRDFRDRGDSRGGGRDGGYNNMNPRNENNRGDRMEFIRDRPERDNYMQRDDRERGEPRVLFN